MTFKNDLKEAQEIEYQLMTNIIGSGYTCTSTQSCGNFPDYDLIVTPKDKPQFTIELKYDKKASTTGNIAIEVGKLDYDGNEVVSGLSVTSSDYYVYYFNSEWWMINTNKLKDKLSKINPIIVHGGDYSKTILNLVPMGVFKKWARRF
ncbi:hypothetical protein [Pedobacter steynii]